MEPFKAFQGTLLCLHTSRFSVPQGFPDSTAPSACALEMQGENGLWLGSLSWVSQLPETSLPYRLGIYLLSE